jgi:predicted cobalt transporter CbtA
MARRAPTNPRYQKYTGPEGKTRKSAAAAKPKKASSGSSKPSTSGKSASGSKSKSRTSAIAMRNPETPEFKAYRRQWWIALVAGLALTGVSYALQRFVTAPWARTAQAMTLGLAYACIIFAFYIDWTKMRPLRKEAYEQQKSGKAPKPAAEKPSKAEAKAAKRDAEARDSADTGSDDE